MTVRWSLVGALAGASVATGAHNPACLGVYDKVLADISPVLVTDPLNPPWRWAEHATAFARWADLGVWTRIEVTFYVWYDDDLGRYQLVTVEADAPGVKP